MALENTVQCGRDGSLFLLCLAFSSCLECDYGFWGGGSHVRGTLATADVDLDHPPEVAYHDSLL